MSDLETLLAIKVDLEKNKVDCATVSCSPILDRAIEFLDKLILYFSPEQTGKKPENALLSLLRCISQQQKIDLLPLEIINNTKVAFKLVKKNFTEIISENPKISVLLQFVEQKIQPVLDRLIAQNMTLMNAMLNELFNTLYHNNPSIIDKALINEFLKNEAEAWQDWRLKNPAEFEEQAWKLNHAVKGLIEQKIFMSRDVWLALRKIGLQHFPNKVPYDLDDNNIKRREYILKDLRTHFDANDARPEQVEKAGALFITKFNLNCIRPSLSAPNSPTFPKNEKEIIPETLSARTAEEEAKKSKVRFSLNLKQPP